MVLRWSGSEVSSYPHRGVDTVSGVNAVEWVRFLTGVAILVVLACALLRVHRVALGWRPVTAVLRAGIQLAAITVLLSGVRRWPWLVLGFVALMLTTASWTGAGRAAKLPGGPRHAVIAVATGGVVSPAIALALGMVSGSPEHVVAISGIVIGAAMNIVTLTSRRIHADLEAYRGEVEGWLALGATPSQSTAWLRRNSVREALLPNLDQIRNTGLVTLPGAFIGALFGGASPLEAGKFQITVLSAIFLGAVITGTVFSTLAGRSRVLPSPAGE